MFGKLTDFTKNSDLLIAVGLIVTLGVMIVPIPPMGMDLFIALVTIGGGEIFKLPDQMRDFRIQNMVGLISGFEKLPDIIDD